MSVLLGLALALSLAGNVLMVRRLRPGRRRRIAQELEQMP